MPGWAAAPLVVAVGFSAASGQAVETLRLALAAAAVTLTNQELSLALIGLMLLRSGGRVALDAACLGWGFIAAAHALAAWTSAQSSLSWAFLGAGAFLLGGLWPFAGSWMAPDEGWGRRIGRGLVALHVIGVALPAVPVAMEAWAPWAVFIPGVGLLWCAALALSPQGQRCGLTLLWFFELHMIALVSLGTRSSGSLHLLVWGAILPLLLVRTLAVPRANPSPPGRAARLLASVAIASVLAVPGSIGFAARFTALSGLLSSSPAGLLCYVVGVLLVPAFLRPVRDQLRTASCPTPLMIACCLAAAGILALGIAPGLATRSGSGVWLWRFLLG